MFKKVSPTSLKLPPAWKREREREKIRNRPFLPPSSLPPSPRPRGISIVGKTLYFNNFIFIQQNSSRTTENNSTAIIEQTKIFPCMNKQHDDDDDDHFTSFSDKIATTLENRRKLSCKRKQTQKTNKHFF